MTPRRNRRVNRSDRPVFGSEALTNFCFGSLAADHMVAVIDRSQPKAHPPSISQQIQRSVGQSTNIGELQHCSRILTITSEKY